MRPGNVNNFPCCAHSVRHAAVLVLALLQCLARQPTKWQRYVLASSPGNTSTSAVMSRGAEIETGITWPALQSCDSYALRRMPSRPPCRELRRRIDSLV